MENRKILGVETAEILCEKTHRFFDMTLKDEFWTWVELYYFLDVEGVVEDLAEFEDVNTSEKIIEIIITLADLIDNKDIMNRVQLQGNIQQLKEEFGYNQVFILKTMIKILIKYFNM